MKINKCIDCRYAYKDKWVDDWCKLVRKSGERSDLENVCACAKHGINVDADKEHRLCPSFVKKGPVRWRNRLVERRCG